MFPPIKQKFILRVDDTEYMVKIDNQHRIWAAPFRDKIGMREGALFEITKMRGVYVLRQLSK